MQCAIQLSYDPDAKRFTAECQMPNGLVTATGHTPDDALGQIGGALLGIVEDASDLPPA